MIKNRYPGNFILIEGLDRAGKTTAAQKVVERIGGELNLIYMKGGGSDSYFGKLARKYGKTLFFLLELLVATRILRRNLREGKNVLMDRYFFFVSSHIPDVYRPFNKVLIWIISHLILQPNLVIYFDVSREERIKRLKNPPPNKYHAELIEDLPIIDKRNAVYRQILDKYHQKVIDLDTTEMSIREMALELERIVRICLEEDLK